MSKYNGHKNYNHWNVSLWINNDEMLYKLAIHCIRYVKRRKLGDKSKAAQMMLGELTEGYGITKTPDGTLYTKTTILAAMRGIE